LVRFTGVVAKVAVCFFGGFLGAIGVLVVNYFLGLTGLLALVGGRAPQLELQLLQNFSWGGAMWGFLAAALLITRKKNVVVISVVTMIIAVTYGIFVLQKLPMVLTSKIIFAYAVNLVYSAILALTIKASGVAK
jgi:hypothetical protein